MVQDCPKCRLVNPPGAQRCDCGYDFVSKSVEQPYGAGRDARRGGSKAGGYALLVLGPLWLFGGLLAAGRQNPDGAYGAGVLLGAMLPGVVVMGLGAYLLRPRR